MNVDCLLFGGKRMGERRDHFVFALISDSFFWSVHESSLFSCAGKTGFFMFNIQRKYAKYNIFNKGRIEMKKIASLSLLVFLSVFALFACGNETVNNQNQETNQETTQASADYPKTFTDGRGKEVTIKEKPSRIVSTTLAIDEYLLPLVEKDRIAAVTKMSTDSGISNVADLTDGIETKIESVTSELVLSLQPDLVLIPSYVDPEVLNQIEAAGITTYQLKDDSSFSGVLEGLKEVAAIVGEEEKAEDILAGEKEKQ